MVDASTKLLQGVPPLAPPPAASRAGRREAMVPMMTRREFADGFKREAVVLLRDSGRPLTQVAAELGLAPSVLRQWRSLANAAEEAASAVRSGAAAVATSAGQVGNRPS